MYRYINIHRERYGDLKMDKYWHQQRNNGSAKNTTRVPNFKINNFKPLRCKIWKGKKFYSYNYGCF